MKLLGHPQQYKSSVYLLTAPDAAHVADTAPVVLSTEAQVWKLPTAWRLLPAQDKCNELHTSV